MNRTRRSFLALVVLSVTVTGVSLAQVASRAVVTSHSSLKWSDAGIPGVSTSVVEGDLSKGPSHFYLKYAAGFVAPVHHHSPDHYVTTVAGTLVLIMDGKEQRLAPGSYFALTGKASHAARCEGSEDCVMFVQALGPWDVVPEKAATASH